MEQRCEGEQYTVKECFKNSDRNLKISNGLMTMFGRDSETFR